MSDIKNDISQIRYHMKNEKLNSKKEENEEEIKRLLEQENEIFEKLKHTLERQERIESETNSPSKLRRAPSLHTNAKYELIKNKLNEKGSTQKNQNPKETFASYFNDQSSDKESSVHMSREGMEVK